MGKWKEVQIKDIAELNKNSYSKSEELQYVNYLDTGNITKNNIDEIKFIDLEKEKLPSRAKRKVKYNSIIYSTVRPNQSHYGIIKNRPSNYLVSTGFVVIDVIKEKVNANFLYYYLIQDSITETLQSIAEQSVSAYPSIKAQDIGNLFVQLPDRIGQEKVAKILLDIDHKIELNNRINDNLVA